MGAKRKTPSKHLPERVYHKHNAYYFVDKNNKWVRLGKDLSAAMQKWVEIVQPSNDILTMTQLFDRYMLEVAPKKAPATYNSNKREILVLRQTFAPFKPSEVKPKDIYKFLDLRGKTAPTRANREKALLSHIFSFAIRWGIVEDNPCKHVQSLLEERRDRYVTDSELQAVKSLAADNIKFIIDFAYITGLRQLDILKLKINQISNDGIEILVSKTKKKLLIEWSERLRKIVNEAQEYNKNLHSEYLFPNTQGKQYTSSGFQTVWWRLMAKAMDQKVINERFHFHDIRRKTATDLNKRDGIEQARKLLGHTHQKMTSEYISGAERVRPIE